MGRGLSQLPLLSSFEISGPGSHFGLALGTWVFHWAGLFLGPGEWACEPYFSNPITKSQSQSQPTVLMRPTQKNKNKNTFLIYKETKTKIIRLNYIIMLLRVIYTPDDNISKELI